jgi:hypothetical protein
LQAAHFDSTRGPKVICVETVSGADNRQDAAIETLLTDRGYRVLGRTVANVIMGAGAA